MDIVFGFITLFYINTAAAYDLHPIFEKALANEAQLQQNIVEGILDIQQKNLLPNGVRLRGTHSKGSCAKATFEVYSSSVTQKPNLHVGLFSRPEIYQANVRFANAESKVQADQEKDVRSMSFSVNNIPEEISNPQRRIDFSTNNATTFPINDAGVFSTLMLASLGKSIGPLDYVSIGDAMFKGSQMKDVAKKPYQKMRYWSGVPFLLGTQAIKYSLKACSENGSQPLTDSPDTLGKELVRHLENDKQLGCFEFQVQILDASKLKSGFMNTTYPTTDWIENATWEWSEKQLPFVTIAKLTLDNSEIITPGECEKWRFNVNKNTSETHRGLGSINRARTNAEEASSQNRP